ncbi:hypothetical protein RBB50_012190 [Rhinocladiella similis]
MLTFVSSYVLACTILLKPCIAAATIGTTTNICPLLGPAFPKPTGLSSNEGFQKALQHLDDDLVTALETGVSIHGSAPFNATTFSVGMFDTDEDDLIYQHHYVNEAVRASAVGTNDPDSDSVYRLGSITKLLTAYLWMIHMGDETFGDPVTKYIPELLDHASSSEDRGNGALPKWDEITIGQLASHMAGLTDYGLNEIRSDPVSLGLPPLTTEQEAKCNVINADMSFVPCTSQEFLSGLTAEPAFFHPVRRQYTATTASAFSG